MNPDYLIEVRELEKKIDIEEAYLNYEDTCFVVIDFFKKVVLQDCKIKKLKVSEAAEGRASFYIKKSEEYAKKIISEDDFDSQAARAWEDFKNFSGSDKRLIRLILCCLIGRDKYLKSVNADMQDDYISFILKLAFDLEKDLGKSFRQFVELHPAMQKYKVKI